MNINEASGTLSSIAKGIVGLGLSLVVVALVVDVLFPGTTDIVNKVAGVISNFTEHGLVGLITLIVFIAIIGRD